MQAHISAIKSCATLEQRQIYRENNQTLLYEKEKQQRSVEEAECVHSAYVRCCVCVRACISECECAYVCVRNYVKTTIGTFAYCLVWRRMLVVVVVVVIVFRCLPAFKLEIKTNGKFN